MEFSEQGRHFLHIAYWLMFLGQLAYVAFLLNRWRRVRQKDMRPDA